MSTILMDLPASQTSLEPHANTLSDLNLIAHLDENPGSYFIKSWHKIHNHTSMHLFYNSITQSFSAILQSPSAFELIPSTKDGFDLIKIPFLDCKATKKKFMSLPALQLVQFLRKELRYPIIRGDEHDYTVHLNIGGLPGGGAKVSRAFVESKDKEQTKVDQESEVFLNVHDFLVKRYAIRDTKNNDSKDDLLVNKLALRIYNALPTDQASDIDKYLSKGIDACEEEFFEEVVLEVLGKSLEEGRPELTDYIRSFSSGKLCIELLKKGYFARERGRGGVSKVIVDRILTKLGEQTESVIAKLQKKTEDRAAEDRAPEDKAPKDNKEVNFERALMVLETQEKIASLLKPLSKMKHKKVTSFIKHKLNLETDNSEEILNAFYFAENCDELYEQIINDVLAKKLEVDTSSLSMADSPLFMLNDPNHKKRVSSAMSANRSALDISSSDIKLDSTDSKKSKRLPYMDKVRLTVLSELNLLEHDLTTLVELHNMLKADITAQTADSDAKGKAGKNTRSSKLHDIRSLIMGIIRTYKENEAVLVEQELSSLLPLAFVQDVEIFRDFLGAFLEDFSNDILFEAKKVKMLSFIIISALRNPDFKDYLNVDDLIKCFKILKPKIEDLSITTGNLNVQEALSSLNDILFLMGFIGAKGVKPEYLTMVQDLTTHMQTHALEKAFNIFTRKATDPSLAIKREYALEAFKRIEGTSFDNWTENCAKIIQVSQIAMNIGRGLLLGDTTSICTALLQIKDMAMEAYENQPKNWFSDANELKFLSQDPLDKIIKEVFKNTQKHNPYFSFYAAEFMLSIVNQSHRKLREKKAIIQAVWYLANGYDYKQCKAHRYLVRSRTFRPSKDICEYVKLALLAIAESVETDLALFIRKMIETPIKIASLENNQTDFKISMKQNEEEVKYEEDAGKLFYWKVLKEKKPKLYSLAKIQEHSAKTLDKPTIMVDFRGIDGDKDFDDNFERKLKAKIDNTTDRKFLDTLVKAVEGLDPKTATKKTINDLFDKGGATEIMLRGEEEKELKTLKSDLLTKTKEKIEKMKDANTMMLFDTLDVFLDDPSKKVWLLQGDAGTGKSLLLRLMEEKLWKRYNILVKTDVKSRNRLPLRIVLSEVRNFDKAVDEFLLKHGCDPDGIGDIKKEPAVILFDGYDEINQFINLYNQNKLETWTDVKVIFTSRKENLTALKEDYIFCFTPGKDKTKVLSYSILGVNEEQIRKYFNAQAQENVQKIEKLEKKLTTFVGKNLNVHPITEAVKRSVERWKKFPNSEKHECLVEFVATLEEGMPDVEDFQKDLDSLKSDTVEIQPLTEIFKQEIADLRNITNPAYIDAIISKIENYNKVIQKTEDQLANLQCDSYDSTITDINSAIQFLKKVTTIRKISKSLTNLGERLQKALSIDEFGRKRNNDWTGSSSAEAQLTEVITTATPEKFKEIVESAKAKIEEMKPFVKEITIAMNSDSKDGLFETIEKELNKFEQFSDFEKFKTVVEKLQNTLKEFIVIEGEFECLYAKEKVQEKEKEKEEKKETEEEKKETENVAQEPEKEKEKETETENKNKNETLVQGQEKPKEQEGENGNEKEKEKEKENEEKKETENVAQELEKEKEKEKETEKKNENDNLAQAQEKPKEQEKENEQKNENGNLAQGQEKEKEKEEKKETENLAQTQEKEKEPEKENAQKNETENLVQTQEKEQPPQGEQPQQTQTQSQPQPQPQQTQQQEQMGSFYQPLIQPTIIIKIEFPAQIVPPPIEQLPDLEKLKNLIPNLRDKSSALEEGCKELFLFANYNDSQRELRNFVNSANNGTVAAVEKIENKYKKYQRWLECYNEFNSLFTNAIEMFKDQPYYYWSSPVTKLYNTVRHLKELIYLWEVQIILKTLEENVNLALSSIQELRYPKTRMKEGVQKEDSKLIQSLRKQLTVLQTSADQYQARPSISRLDEMIQEIKGLENEVKAIKDASTEQNMAIRTMKNEIERLQGFTDPYQLDSIITKFKDIITSPFMLKMLLETLIRFPSGAANKAELYRLFATIHFEREKDKLLQNEKVPPKFNIMDSFYHYSKDLAVNMFFRKVTSIHAKTHGYKALGFVETLKAHVWARFFDDTDLLTKLARRGAQIIEDDGVIRFMHKSIMEYFAARYFFDEIVDYDPDQYEDYDPSLNRGLIVETETDVYQFLMHIADSQEKTRQNNKDNEKDKGQKGMTVLEKKILEVLGSPHLRKQYGTQFEGSFFYQNVFLILLLNLGLVRRIAELKDDSAPALMIDSIFRWIFDPSGTSHKFIEVILRASEANANLYQKLQPLVHIHYHLISKPNSGIKFYDPPEAANDISQLKVRLCIKSENPSLIVKDGAIVEAENNTVYSWTLDIKLFIYGSQENIAIFSSEAGCFAVKSPEEQNAEKKAAADKKDKNEKDGKDDKNEKKEENEGLKAFVLKKTETPWNVRECKWVLRLNQLAPTEFSVQSMSDPSKILFGAFTTFDEYSSLFKGVCSADANIGVINCSDKVYRCVTCNMTDPDIICENCKDLCHKDHEVVKSEQTCADCSCQTYGLCGIARGCTARLESYFQGRIKYMFKCNQCPDDKKNTVLCVGCKRHHEKDCYHSDFTKFERAEERGVCECNCITNRTKLMASCQQYGYQGYNNFSEIGANIPAEKVDNMDDEEGDDDHDN